MSCFKVGTLLESLESPLELLAGPPCGVDEVAEGRAGLSVVCALEVLLEHVVHLHRVILGRHDAKTGREG